MTSDPIKIRWTGDARTKLETRRFEPAYGGDRHDLMETAKRTTRRQKTNVVIETAEEAAALELFVSELAGSGGPEGRTWATPAHNRAYDRVLREIRDGRAVRGWDESPEVRE